MTLISQTVAEFITDDISKKIFDQFDVTQVFDLKAVSQSVVEYLNLTPAERSFITGPTQGENSTSSESLLSLTGHGRKRISVLAGEFKHHVLDDDLDPWEFMEKVGVVSEGDRANLVVNSSMRSESGASWVVQMC